MNLHLISLINFLISLIPDLFIILLLFKITLNYKTVCQLIVHCWTRLTEWAQFYQHFTIPKHDPYNNTSLENPLYRKSLLYLKSLPTSEESNYQNYLYSSSTRVGHFSVQLAPGQPVVDFFDGARICWTKPSDGQDRLEIRVRRIDRVRVLRPYLMRVEAAGDRIEQNLESRKAAKRAIRRVIEVLREERRKGEEGSRRFRKVKKLWGAIKRRTNCF